LDYLSPNFISMFEMELMHEYYTDAIQFIDKSFDQFVLEKDKKLSDRYAWLKRYYLRNASSFETK